MDDYINHLFAYVSPDRLRTLSCGHVIPSENLIAFPITTGPSRQSFDFTYEKRNSVAMIDDLGHCLIELSQTIPDGLVVFFPSYAYLNQVTVRWQSTIPKAGNNSIWKYLEKAKAVFSESKENSSVESVLREYSEAIHTGKGGLLLSVVGGKMSEGINFSDKLGRGVVIVGLPFPNVNSPEWKAKIKHIEEATVGRGAAQSEGKNAARAFYENACMRMVNQSIGRAIRHKNDYASIILLDRRYNTKRITTKLPGWIQEGLVPDETTPRLFTDILVALKTFFRDKGNDVVRSD